MNTDRIEAIQKDTAYPDSLSVQQALLTVWNETAQDNNATVIQLADKLHRLSDILNSDSRFTEHDVITEMRSLAHINSQDK